MAEWSKISWTDHTFNPWMGCIRVSPGCQNCYAETLVKERMKLDVWGRSPRQQTKAPWQNVRKWNNDARRQGTILKVFTGSLCDVFEDNEIPNGIRPQVWQLIRECEYLDFQLLTKRPQNIQKFLPADWGNGWDNVWLGCSIENQDYAFRKEILCNVPSTVHFISYEPALGPLDIDLSGVEWLIYGGESGKGYRSEDKQWARDIREVCALFGTAFYHKQSAAIRTEMGVELDGKIVQHFPDTRATVSSGDGPSLFD